MISAFIIDDHSLVREGIKKIINEETDMEVVGESSDGLGVLELVDKCNPDIVILDITLPHKSGLDLLKDIKKQFKQLPVLILSMHPEDRYAIRALRNGASGYLTKESVPEEIVDAIHKIVNGRRYISTSLGEKLAISLETWSDKPLHHNLSDREFQIMLMIASDKKVVEISEELFLGAATVNTYRARVFEKMGFNSNIELTHYVLENKLIDL